MSQEEIEEIAQGLFNEFRYYHDEDRGVFIEQGCTWMLDDKDFVWRERYAVDASVEEVEEVFFSLVVGEGEIREADGEEYIFFPVFPPEELVFSGENESKSFEGQLTAFCWFL